MRESSTIRPQDILVLLKLLVLDGKEWKQLDLANELYISPAEVCHSLGRLRASKLIDDDKRGVFRENALEFILFGLKYVFPAKFGPSELGIGTSHSTLPLSKKIKSKDKLVWPYPKGNMRGEVLFPIYSSVPKAAEKDAELHELLALVDAVRIGRVRERELASKELKKRFA